MAHYLFLYFALWIVDSITINYDLSIKTKSVISQIPSPFYGFQFDYWKNKSSGGKWYPNAGILTVNLSNTNLIAYTKALSPAWLRIGGSPQDSIIYNISGECNNVNASLPGYGCGATANNYGCLTVDRWQQINEFAVKTNVSLLFGLNACYGRPSHEQSLNFTNIDQLLNATLNVLPPNSITNLYAFEFGEEVETRIAADIYAHDFYTLHGMVDDYWHKYNKYNKKNINIPFLMAGDVPMSSSSLPWSKNVIGNLSVITNDNASSVLHRVTYHHYPNCGYSATASSVFSLSCLNSIKSYADKYAALAATINITAMMGEGSEHNGGGTANVSNTFVDCFYYIYQLCEILKNKVPGTIRSDLTGGDYELIDHKTFVANPDYWILYLWKQFIGDRMYESSLNSSVSNANFRAYSFSRNNDDVVVVLINFDMKNTANVEIRIDRPIDDEYDGYYLKAIGNGGLQSRTMSVNDVVMEYKNGKFPTLTPRKGNGVLSLDPATIALLVLTPIENS